MIGRVFSIEEFATFDGPGIRTTVFLKGCPLRCSWCHNPEGQYWENDLLKSPNRCIDYTPEQLCEKLMKNAGLLANGGITFSGGEPLAQYEFLTECLRLLRGKLHLAIQTSGFCEETRFRQILDKCDYMLYDLKVISEEGHLRYTGQSNQSILQNFMALCESGLPHVIRLPLIPGVTDTAKNITAVARLMQANGQDYIELLPYNKLAGGKYHLVGRIYRPDFDDSTEPEPRLEIFDEYNIKTFIL